MHALLWLIQSWPACLRACQAPCAVRLGLASLVQLHSVTLVFLSVCISLDSDVDVCT